MEESVRCENALNYSILYFYTLFSLKTSKPLTSTVFYQPFYLINLIRILFIYVFR